MHVISGCFSLSIFIGAVWELKPPVLLRASIPFFFKADVHLTSKWFYKCSLNNTCTRKSIQFFLLPLPWEPFNTFSSQGYLSVSTPLGLFCTVCHTFFFFYPKLLCIKKQSRPAKALLPTTLAQIPRAFADNLAWYLIDKRMRKSATTITKKIFYSKLFTTRCFCSWGWTHSGIKKEIQRKRKH